MITQEQLNQLRKYFSTQPVDVVYLFGSQADGKATKLSDADIAVLFKEGIDKSKRFDLKLAIISKVCGVLKRERVDVVDLIDVPLALKYSAIKPRRELYTANNDRRVSFEATTCSYYFDYMYSLKKMGVSLKNSANLSLNI